MRLSLLLAAAALLPARAFACGGMFCDAANPVDQAAERIVFAFDNGKVNTEVQITYQGEDDDFAWVVPVPAEPELYASNDALFTQLANATVPQFSLFSDSTGGFSLGCAASAEMGFNAREDGDYAGVSVVGEATVGPYDTVTLQATDGDLLIQWLQDQGYSLPDTLGAALDPYVAEGQYFVALKLSSNKTTGDLAPLGMRYTGTAASIPIQLTAIAATPDLPIEVFVLGPSRAVPDNYLHVEINQAAIDWYGGGTNYRAVVSKAVDEAGGQAFATDYVGPAAGLVTLWAPGIVNLEGLSTVSDPIAWLESIVYSGLPGSSQLNAVLLRYVPAPPGVDDATFLSCPGCYTGLVSAPDFDPVEATAAVDDEVFSVLEEQQARLDAATTVTRLFTTMDPAEMTADPFFTFNEDLPQEVSNVHTATDHSHQSLTGNITSRSLELEDGRIFRFPDANTPTLEQVDSPAALLVEDLGASGEGTVLFDGADQAQADADAFSNGCATSESAGAFAPLLILAAGVMRRRRV